MDYIHAFCQQVETHGITKENELDLKETALTAVTKSYSEIVFQSSKGEDESQLDYAYSIFRLDEKSNFNLIDNAYIELRDLIDNCKKYLSLLNLLPDRLSTTEPEANQTLCYQHISLIAGQIHSMRQLIYHTFKLNSGVKNQTQVIPIESIFMTSKIHEEFATNQKKYTGRQQLILYAYQKLSEMCAKKLGDYIAVPKISSTGYNTHVYERKMRISEFLDHFAQESENPHLWLLKTNSTDCDFVGKFLKRTYDVRFPCVKRCQWKFAFNNGIFDAYKKVFTPFKRHDRRPHQHPELRTQPHDTVREYYTNLEKLYDQQIMFDDEDDGDLQKRIEIQKSNIMDGVILNDDDQSPCVYHDCVFVKDLLNIQPENIKTPFHDKIFKDQGIMDHPDSKEIMKWNYAMHGRMLYPVKMMDHWEIAVMHKGRAGTGKSTFLNSMLNLYESQDVGILDNNIEKTFGLYALKDHFIIMCFEMMQWNLEQTEFQSIISGETMQLKIKHQSPIAHQWKSQLLIAGNMFANFNNSQGQVSRRLFMIAYMKFLKKQDPQLASKLKAELPFFLVKINGLYHEMVKKHGKKGIYTEGVLPQYFHDLKELVTRGTNTLVQFICSTEYLLTLKGYQTKCDPRDDQAVHEELLEHHIYMRKDLFQTFYSNWISLKKLHQVNLEDPDSYEGVFEKYGLTLQEGRLPDPDNNFEDTQTIWIVGCAPQCRFSGHHNHICPHLENKVSRKRRKPEESDGN